MTGQEIFEMALTLFDEPSNGKFAKATYTIIVKQLLNQGYREVCRRGLCSRGRDTIVTSSGIREYSFPEECTAIKSIKYNGYPLSIIREDDIVSDIVGSPLAYYIAIDKIGIEPIPDKDYTLDTVYYKKPNQEIQIEEVPLLIPEEWHYVISYYLVKEFFKIDKGDRSQGFAKWNAIYEEELFKLKNYYLEGTNADQFVGVR
jgi:hypothetical protein